MAIDARPAGRGLVVVLAVGGTILTGLVLFPRIFRRNRDLLVRLGPVERLLTTCDDMARRISGTQRSSWGLLTHVGRHSGHIYQTSLGAHPYRDGFLLPLGDGPHTDWYQNLVAAGVCTLAWKGHTYWLERPELISGPEVRGAWPIGPRILLQLGGIHDFVWLHQSREGHPEPPPVTSSAQQAAE